MNQEHSQHLGTVVSGSLNRGVEVRLGGGQEVYGIRRYVTIPWGAPFGSPYRLCVRTGEHPGAIWAEDCFEFAIVPPVEW